MRRSYRKGKSRLYDVGVYVFSAGNIGLEKELVHKSSVLTYLLAVRTQRWVLACEIWVTQLRAFHSTLRNILLFSILTFSSPSSTITIWLLNVGPFSLALTRNVAPKRNSTRRPLRRSHSNIIICKCARKYEGRHAPFLIICLSSPLLRLYFRLLIFFFSTCCCEKIYAFVEKRHLSFKHREKYACQRLFDSKGAEELLVKRRVEKNRLVEISRSALLGFAL